MKPLPTTPGSSQARMTLVEALRYHASLMIAPEVAPKVRALLNDASTVMWAAAEALSTESESERSITIEPVDFVCLKEPRCKAPCGGRNCHVAPSAGLSISSDMAARMEILARRLKDCDYPDRGTIQCGTAGNANLVRYNGEDIVGCAHVYDERDRLLLGWLAENAPRILEALSTRSATERRGVTFDAERYYREYRDGLYGVGWQRDETTSHEHVDSLEATVNAALNVHGGFLIVPVGPGTTEGERG